MNDPLRPGAPPLKFAGFTRLSKLLVGFLFSTYALSWVSPKLISYLALIPGKTLPCVWNVVTAGLVESNVWMLLFDATTLLLMAGHLEPTWGSKEFLKFVTVINTTVGVSAFVIMMSLYFCTGSEYYLYGQLHGFHGVIGALFVALKQSIPEYEVKLFVCISLKVKYLPVLLVFTAIVISEVIMDDDLVMFTLFGTYSGWMYLRYYQQNALTGTKGDPSEAMMFSSFFPAVCRPFLDKVGNLCHKVMCSSRGAATNPNDVETVMGTPLPGSDSSEAQRRRERGARALEERLTGTSEGCGN